MFAEKLSPNKNLAYQGFRARDIEVRLKIPPTADTPSARLHEFLNTPEQRRIISLYPLIEDRLVVIEDEAFVLVKNIDGISKRRQRLGTSFFPSPLPDRIEVSIADQMNGWLSHTVERLGNGV
jgi:hypothetical protein